MTDTKTVKPVDVNKIEFAADDSPARKMAKMLLALGGGYVPPIEIVEQSMMVSRQDAESIVADIQTVADEIGGE